MWKRGIVVVLLAFLALGCTGSDPDESVREVRRVANPDIEVFLRTNATPAQIAAVRAAIERSPVVQKYAFLSKQGALREIRRLFSDQPDLAASTDPKDLPVSFQLSVPEANRSRLARSLKRVAGVDEVKTLAQLDR